MNRAPDFIVTRVWNLLKPDKIEIRNSYLFAVFSGVLSLGLPLGIQMIINFIQLGQLSASWFLLVGLVVVAIGISGIMNILQLRIMENLQQRIFTRSAFDFSCRIPQFKMEAIRRFYSPELSSRFFDTLTIQKSISKLLIDFMAASLQIIFGLGLLAFYHSFFIFFGLSLLTLLFLLIRFTSRAGYSTSLKESSIKYKIANWLSEINMSRAGFKMTDSKSQLRKTDSLLNDYLDARKNHFKILVTQYKYLVLFKVLITLCLLILGGVLVVNQQMNIGQFVASEIIIVLVLSSVEKIILNLDLVYDVITAIEKIGQVSDISLDDKAEGNKLTSENSGLQITVKNMNYESNEFSNAILKNISFDVVPNEKVSIISDSNVSSNVLFMLILGIYEKQTGTINIDNIPIENLTIELLRRVTSTLIAQDKLLFGTFHENISFYDPNIPFDQIINITHQLGMSEFVDSMPNKFEAEINPDSYLIPAEIEKKILLARALSRNPKLLLLEEPTSGLNESDKKLVVDSLFSLPHCSTLIVSKDPKIHALSDKIIEIKKGEIVYIGNFETYSNHTKSC